MSDSFESERNKISQIAGEVRSANSQIRELEEQARQLESELASLPQVMDEDGNDLNESYRNGLEELQSELEEEIRRRTAQRNAAMGRAAMLAASYSKEAENEKINAQQHAKTAQGMKALSGKRFGASAAAATAAASEKRAAHYEKNASLYQKLAQAAERARQGIAPGEIGTASQKERVQMPGARSFGADSASGSVSGSRGAGIGAGHGAGGMGAAGQGHSSGAAKQPSAAAAAVYSRLGIEGIPYDGGAPVYEAVSHARESVTMAAPGTSAAAAHADAALARKLGQSALQAAAYRQENGLVWCMSKDGNNAYLVPRILQEETSGGCVCPEPTPAEKEAAYMQSHGYTAADRDQYAYDPEYLVLHQQAHPEEQVAPMELPREVRTSWVEQVVPGCSRQEAQRIVNSMEEYSSISGNYREVHQDEKAQLQQTRDMLKVFDSGNVTPYQGEIHRGLSFDSYEDAAEMLYDNGDIWTEPGITSFSADKGTAEEFASRKQYGLVLRCRNNHTAIPFRHMSECDWENEVLSPGQHRNQGWNIDYDSVRYDPVKRILYVDIEEIGG